MFITGKTTHGIGVFLESNLNFTIRVFVWGLANDLHICKIQFQICEGSHNAKVLQLD